MHIHWWPKYEEVAELGIQIYRKNHKQNFSNSRKIAAKVKLEYKCSSFAKHMECVLSGGGVDIVTKSEADHAWSIPDPTARQYRPFGPPMSGYQDF